MLPHATIRMRTHAIHLVIPPSYDGEEKASGSTEATGGEIDVMPS
jgi:hypothetical protein